jgi:hypothetical protein
MAVNDRKTEFQFRKRPKDLRASFYYEDKVPMRRMDLITIMNKTGSESLRKTTTVFGTHKSPPTESGSMGSNPSAPLKNLWYNT